MLIFDFSALLQTMRSGLACLPTGVSRISANIRSSGDLSGEKSLENHRTFSFSNSPQSSDLGLS